MKQTICTFCGRMGHTSVTCFKKQRKPIKINKDKLGKIKYPFSKKQKQDNETKMQWIQANPPVNGGWNCYLHISPLCLKFLTIETLTVDHIKPKGTHRDLRHDLKNLAPACLPCNNLKGSRTLDTKHLSVLH